MVNVNIILDGEEMNFSIPNSWDEVTIKQASLIEEIDREEVNTELKLYIEWLKILSGMSKDIILQMTPVQFNEIKEQLLFLSEVPTGKTVESVVIDGEEYFLLTEYDKLTMGEIISLDTLLEPYDGQITTGNMNELLCVLLRRKKENGKLESFKADFMSRAKKFEEVKITDVKNLFLFFYNGENESPESIVQ